MPLRHDLRRGALCLVAAGALFTAMNALVKGLGERIPFVEIMLFRSLFALPVAMAIAVRGGGGRGGVLARLRTRRPWGHAVRALAGTVAQGLAFFAITVLPLATQTALGYTTPLFVTLLAIPFLGEKVGVHRWSAVLLGFAGVVVIALGQGAPSGPASPLLANSLLMWGTVAAVVQGLFSAGVMLLVRNLSATESSTTIVLWQSLLMTLFTLVAVPFFWVTPGWGELGLLIAVGLVGGVAQVLLTEAYASAQVSALGPYSYSSLLWSILLGWAVWGDAPGAAMLAGAALIVTAGLYILRREAVLRRRRAEGGG